MVKKLEGKKCPNFQGECTSGVTLSNKDFVGKNLVIYFYPKDSTPGCTTEGNEFTDNYKITYYPILCLYILLIYALKY